MSDTPKSDLKELESIRAQLESTQAQLESINKQLEKLHFNTLRFRTDHLDSDLEEARQRIRDAIDSNIRARTADYLLYFSIFVSSVVGVLGNFFVSLWFQPYRLEIGVSLAVFSLIILASLGFLVHKTRKAKLEIEKEWKKTLKYLIDNPKMAEDLCGLVIEPAPSKRKL